MLDKHPLPIALEGPEPTMGRWPAPDHAIPDDERIVYPGEGSVFALKDQKEFEE